MASTTNTPAKTTATEKAADSNAGSFEKGAAKRTAAKKAKASAAAKKRSSAAVAEGKRRTAAAKTKADAKAKAQAEQKKLVEQARKDPTSLTVEQRRKVATATVPGLKGKARKLWIEKGETPAETVKRQPAKKAAGKKAPTVEEAIVATLEKGPATIKQLIEKVSKMRGTATDRAVITRITRKGQLAGRWTIEPTDEGRLVTLKK